MCGATIAKTAFTLVQKRCTSISLQSSKNGSILRTSRQFIDITIIIVATIVVVINRRPHQDNNFLILPIVTRMHKKYSSNFRNAVILRIPIENFIMPFVISIDKQ